MHSKFIVLLPVLSCLLYMAMCFGCTVKAPETLAMGTETVLCVHFKLTSLLSTTETTFPFTVSMDEYAGLSITGLKEKVLAAPAGSKGELILQYANSQNSKTMVLFDVKADISRTVLSVVMSVSKGVVQDLVLDNPDCSICTTSDSTQKCIAEAECFDAGYKMQSEPLLFVSWVGSDSAGDYCLSHTRRLSRFNQYSVGSIYQSAKAAIQQKIA